MLIRVNKNVKYCKQHDNNKQLELGKCTFTNINPLKLDIDGVT